MAVQRPVAAFNVRGVSPSNSLCSASMISVSEATHPRDKALALSYGAPGRRTTTPSKNTSRAG